MIIIITYKCFKWIKSPTSSGISVKEASVKSLLNI